MKRALIYLAVVASVVALLAFGLSRDPRTLPSALIGKPAPDFSLTSLEGEVVSLSALKGSPVVLNFWSTWCSTCVAEHRLIREATRLYEPKDVHFYSVLYEDTPDNARAFLKQYGDGAPILLDPNLRTAIDYGVAGVPETFFINADGIVTFKQTGMLTPNALEEGLK